MGIKLISNGKSFDTLGVEQKLKEQVIKLKWKCKKNPLKGYAFYQIYIDSVVRY